MEYAWSIAQSYILPKPEIILKRRQNAGFKKKKNVFNNNCTYSPIVNYYQHSPDINISIYQSIFNQYILLLHNHRAYGYHICKYKGVTGTILEENWNGKPETFWLYL